MPSESRRCLAPHRVCHAGAHVASLGDIARVAEAFHQFRPGSGDAARLPAKHAWGAGEPKAGQGRNHDIERVRGAPSVGGRIRERIDDVEQLDH